jgi:transcriptional regulator with XRE-family HTH domain
VPILKKFPLALRLERLRSSSGKTWDALASDLGIKRAMIFHVLSGRRGFSDQTLQRLVDCEVAAGVRTEASVLIERGLQGEELIEALINSDEAGHSKVTTKDIDAGSLEIVLEYRRGSPPPGFPKTTRVTAPRNATIWTIIGEKGTRHDPSLFLAASLPDLQDKPDVLERLTPSCYALLLDTALDLTFGLNWRSKLQPISAARKKKAT